MSRTEGQDEWIWPWQHEEDPEPEDLKEEPMSVACIRAITRSESSAELKRLWSEIMDRWHQTGNREHLHWSILCAFASNPHTPAAAHRDIFRLGGWAAHMAQTSLTSSTPKQVLVAFAELQWEDIKIREGYAHENRGRENLQHVQNRAHAGLAERAIHARTKRNRR